ncbi:MAG: uracil-DNA glycosylase [Opitutus sp.]|nr:uracil-DNA glycosylase [Opitutus sp.]
MRHALHALNDELRRLKSSGVRTVSVSDESVAALRRAVAGRTEKAGGIRVLDTPRAGPKPAAAAVVIKPYEPPPYRPAPAVQPVVPVAPAPLLPPDPVIVLPDGDKGRRWAALLEAVANDATCRANVRPGKKIVLGVGALEAKIMFVGEAPGAEEEIQGEPFVGPAGQLLTKMIQAMGLKRSEVYIGNIMNWRPQMPTVEGGEQVGNRPPTQDEMRYCLPYLRAQIEVVNPALLVALGTTAAQGLLGFGSFKMLGDIRGKWHEFGGKPLMVTYHPSYILRSQSNRSKRLIWEDLLKVMERVALPISEKQRGFFLER